MARSWLSIRVDLIAGHGQILWPRPRRIFAISRSHLFAQFATAIDDAFASWDRSHLREFTRVDGEAVNRSDKVQLARFFGPQFRWYSVTESDPSQAVTISWRSSPVMRYVLRRAAPAWGAPQPLEMDVAACGDIQRSGSSLWRCPTGPTLKLICSARWCWGRNRRRVP